MTNQAILDNPKINWNYKRYLNIWIVNNKLTLSSAPHLVLDGVDMTKLQGVTFIPVGADDVGKVERTSINQIGVLFHIVDFATECNRMQQKI